MATYLQFSGFHESVPNTTSKSAGLMIFSTWDFNAQEYLQSDTITINTPGVPNIEGIAVDAQPAGCFINNITTLPNGFGFGVGDQNTNDPNFVEALPYFSTGVLNIATYKSGYGEDWGEYSAILGGFNLFDQTTIDEKPGELSTNESDYTVILPATVTRGLANPQLSGGRTVYVVSSGGLAQFAIDQIEPYSAYSSGWVLSPGSSDEEAAAHLLVNGYGILQNTDKVFWTETP
mgnify:FL=1